MNTSIIKVHAFSGAQSEAPPCYLLQVDDFQFLLDCGLDDQTSITYLMQLERYVRDIDAVLISHPTITHVGALPYLVGKCGLRCPVYSTVPVHRMGQMFLYDLFESRFSTEDFTLFTLDDVDNAFDQFVQLKYNQTVNLHGKGHGISITPFAAGHTLGGTIWRIVKEDEKIVYMVDYNHKKERHLGGANFENCLRPSLLLTDALRITNSQSRRRNRDEQLMTTILKTLRKNGNVLIAVDSAGRCLELAHFLEQLWHNQESGLMAYNLAMLSHVAFNVIEFAKSQVEWMSQKIMRAFEDQRTNPFHLRHMRLCHTMADLEKIGDPKVVLASSSDLQTGYARNLFADWASEPNNSIILTEMGQPGTLARQLIDNPQLKNLTIDLHRKVPMEGEELDAYRRRRQAEVITRRQFRPVINHSVSIEPGGGDGPVINSQVPNVIVPRRRESHLDGIMNVISTENGMEVEEEDEDELELEEDHQYDILHGAHTGSGGLWFRAAKRTHLVFPFSDRSLTIDEYGEPIDSKEYFLPIDAPTGQMPAYLVAAIQKAAAQAATQDGGDATAARMVAAIPEHQQTMQVPKKEFQKVRRGYLVPVNSGAAASATLASLLNSSQALPTTPRQQSRVGRSAGSGGAAIGAGGGGAVVINSSVSEMAAAVVANEPIPEQAVVDTRQIRVAASILYIDFEGRSDGEAMKRLVSRFKAREIIVVRAPANDTAALAEFCRTTCGLEPDKIHTPSVGDTIDVTKELHIYQARMKDSLVSSLNFFKVRDSEVAWIDAYMTYDSGRTEDGEDSDQWEHGVYRPQAIPTLVRPPGKSEEHKTVLVNEPKLSDMKNILQEHGMLAEFIGGVLVINNRVALKRSEAGKLLLEGCVSEDYFKTREILYSQFAIL